MTSDQAETLIEHLPAVPRTAFDVAEAAAIVIVAFSSGPLLVEFLQLEQPVWMAAAISTCIAVTLVKSR